MSTATAIEKLPDTPLPSIEAFNEYVKEYSEHAIILTPMAHVDHLMPMCQISRRYVNIDPTVPGKNKSGRDCYHSGQFCDPDEVALGKGGLTKIIGAAGASIVQRLRLDGRRDPNYCEITMYLAVQDFDGVWRLYPGTRELDLRDGAAETLVPEYDRNERKTGRMIPLSASALNAARKTIQSRCETFAIERATRGMFSIPPKFKAEELKRKPIVVPKLVPMLDTKDPEVKTALIQALLNPQRALYPVIGPGRGEEIRMMEDVRPAKTTLALGAPTNGNEEQLAAKADEGTPAAPVEHARKVAARAATAPPPEESIDDFDAPDLSAPKAPQFVCACPCGCQAEITVNAHEVTTKAIGVARCVDCFPGTKLLSDTQRSIRWFKRHRELKDLAIPKWPKITAEEVVQRFQAGQKAAP